MNKVSAHVRLGFGLGFVGIFGALALLHEPLLRLPYFWDEAGYYIPAALDFFRHGLLIPHSTLPTGHTPLVSISLAFAWWLFGYAPLVTRLAMLAFAAATLVALYALGRTVARRETALWACLLLAISPLFFAQSSLAFLDLPAAFTTTIALWALLRRRMAWFAVAASLAVLTKETAIVIVPVAILFAWMFRKPQRKSVWLWLASPAAVLGLWAVYYHHVTGYWTGGAAYLQYNLYSTLKPARIATSLLRRLYQVFVAGFNWLLVVVALLGYRQMKKAASQTGKNSRKANAADSPAVRREFFLLTVGLAAIYIALLSVVGGAVLPRYLLPMFPCFYLLLAVLAEGLPRRLMRVAFVLITVSFVASLFINPPYPFPFEDNLAYADFIQLHQQAAEWLSAQPNHPRILTAWPATDELRHPKLGYVKSPLRVVGVPGFRPQDFRGVADNSFDLVYLYSRKWNPPDNWLRRFPLFERADEYTPPIAPVFLVLKFHLRQVAAFHRRGQWIRIYARYEHSPPVTSSNF